MLELTEQGDDGTAELDWRTRKPPKLRMENESSKNSTDNHELRVTKEIDGGLRVYFPSRDTVASSKGGIGVSSPAQSLSALGFRVVGVSLGANKYCVGRRHRVFPIEMVRLACISSISYARLHK
jgi:hypothetical protein